MPRRKAKNNTSIEKKSNIVNIKVKRVGSKKKKINKKTEAVDLSELRKEELKEDNIRPEQEFNFKNYDHKIEQDKKLMLWSAIIFFMILILVFWAMNFDKIFSISQPENKTKSEFNWNKISEEFSQTMSEVREGIGEIKNNWPEAENNEEVIENQDEQIFNNNLPDSNLNEAENNTELSEKEVLELRDKLKDIESEFEEAGE
ncbi:MAG: hypothetical protein ABH830_01585 [Patescibacteria group bacterium]